MLRSADTSQKVELLNKLKIHVSIELHRITITSHFTVQHQVGFCRDQLNKSPRTLVNVFALHEQESPLQIIHERIGLEARRLLSFTDQTVTEVATHLSFMDPSYFARVFRAATGQSPAAFRQAMSELYRV